MSVADEMQTTVQGQAGVSGGAKLALASACFGGWNAARMVTGIGPLVTSFLIGTFRSVSSAALGMNWVFLLGSIAVWFGPETHGLGLQD